MRSFESSRSSLPVRSPREKTPRFPPLCGSWRGLCGRRAVLVGRQTPNLCDQSPVANFQYPNFLGGNSVRERGDRFDISAIRYLELVVLNLSGAPRRPSDGTANTKSLWDGAAWRQIAIKCTGRWIVVKSPGMAPRMMGQRDHSAILIVAPVLRQGWAGIERRSNSKRGKADYHCETHGSPFSVSDSVARGFPFPFNPCGINRHHCPSLAFALLPKVRRRCSNASWRGSGHR